MKYSVFLLIFAFSTLGFGQDDTAYKKRVLEATEIELLFSYYGQDGENAAVTGGLGSEALTNATSALVVSIPLNDDAVLTADVGISAYTSASSSNVNPLDGEANRTVSPLSASSGASRQDVLVHFNPSYQYSSNDRRSVTSANAYVSSEYDYTSLGFGGGYTRQFNRQNTALSVNAKIYFDTWNPQYPIELRSGFFDTRTTGSGLYAPIFEPFTEVKRNTYAISLSATQVLGKRWQGAVFVDAIMQNGLLGTPFQRVYFSDTEDFFIEDFQLADDIERLPDSRTKLPVGARLNYYLNDRFVLRSYYRFYFDDWGIKAHTASLEVPIKLSNTFSLSPNYRLYTQSASDYFYPAEQALSTLKFYTSDYDLSAYRAHQFGLGLRYTDIFTSTKILNFGIKNVNLRMNHYSRSNGLNAFIVSLGTTFVAN